MNLSVRKKIVSCLGVIGICVQMYRYAFDLLNDSVVELFVFCAFFLMSINLKTLLAIIMKLANKITRSKNANQ